MPESARQYLWYPNTQISFSNNQAEKHTLPVVCSPAHSILLIEAFISINAKAEGFELPIHLARDLGIGSKLVLFQ